MEFIQVSSPLPQEHPAWKKAALSTSQADPFCCTPIWQLSFHQAFSPKRRLLVEEHPDWSMAFAEKAFSPERVFLTPVEPAWFLGCPLLGRLAPEKLADALPFLEKTYAPFFPRIMVSGIRPNGMLTHRLRRLFGRRFHLFLHSSGLQCAASLAGGMDGYMSRRSANHRNKLKKNRRKALEQGIFFERVLPASGKEVEDAYSRMLDVERRSWKGIDRCGMAEPPSRQFYALMLQHLSRSGEGRIIFARQEDKDIGFIFGGLAGRIYRGQQFSYDDEWKAFSPGNLLQWEQIAWLCEEGAARYDMGPLDGPRMSYKRHWTEKEMEMQTWMLKRQ